MATPTTATLATPAVQEQPIASFCPFPRLPIELRWMIWTYAFPQRRVVDIFAHKAETWTELDSIPKRLKLNIDTEDPGQTIHVERIFARLYPTPLSAVNYEARSFLPAGYRHFVTTDLKLTDNYVCGKHSHMSGVYGSPIGENDYQTYFLADERKAANYTKLNLERDVLFFRALGSQTTVSKRLDLGQMMEVYLGWTPKGVQDNVKHLAIHHDDQDFWTEPGKDDEWIEPLRHFPNLDTLYVVHDEFRQVRFSSDGKRILRGQERREEMKGQRHDALRVMSSSIDYFAEKNPDWKSPEIKVVRNTKALRREVERVG